MPNETRWTLPWLTALRDGLRAGEDPKRLWRTLPPAYRDRIATEWFAYTGRGDQTPPEGEWLTWLLLGGRGAGKTRTGAEWIRGVAVGDSRLEGGKVKRIALVGETFADVREVMIEGVSGLLAVHGRWERPQWYPARRLLVWRNGVRAHAFSSEDPEGLRGPQFGAAWADELAKWRHAEMVWDMLQFGLRLGSRPRQVVTTTPRPTPLLRRLIADGSTVVSRATTRDNLANLAPAFLTRVVGRYAGTRLGRQELDGEMIEDRADALWRRSDIEMLRLAVRPPLARIVVAVDPPATRRSGRCGIVAAGIDRAGMGYVLADATLAAVRPTEWAARAVALYRRLEADALVAEVNQGGDMVASVIREVDASVPVREVRATRGKWLRAEPVAALYAQGRVHHVGPLPELEDEMADFGIDGLSAGRSPDRLDALVWALTALMLDETGAPRVRGM